MAVLLSRISVTRQFMLLAGLGVALTLAALALTLKGAYDLAYEGKKAEIKHETEEAAAIMRHFVEAAATGALSLEEAQKRAFESVASIRFDTNNYIFIENFDGFYLVSKSPSEKFIKDCIAFAS